jgi:hypothetical protein
MVLVVGEGITMQSPGWLDWSATLAGALVLVPSSFRVHQIPIGGECPICGSTLLYVDGSPSNLSLRKAEVPGPCLA